MDAKEKRRRVMSRSMKLGHCVCDPAKPCPCPLFRSHGVCTCAGEHLPAPAGDGAVRLLQHVRSAGCASKIGQKDLHDVLGRLPPVTDPRLVVGAATADDAGVFELQPGLLLVQTVDVFTPGVDDPYLFGRIAACNSLSDVYAMGGRPVTALSVIGFPIHTLPAAAMAEILRGGMDVLAEAGAVLLGGHSLNDEEVKFGFAVTGLVERSQMTTNAGGRPGDWLVLTKPLGTGILSLATQLGRASAAAADAAAASMGSLNRRAAEIMVRHGATACTDVTGFGLLGHLSRLAIESDVSAEVWCDRLPLLPEAVACAAAGTYSGANERNAEFTAEHCDFDPAVTEELRAVLHDAQTSGGLLIALPDDRLPAALEELQAARLPAVAVIGRLTAAGGPRIRVLPGPLAAPIAVRTDGEARSVPAASTGTSVLTAFSAASDAPVETAARTISLAANEESAMKTNVCCAAPVATGDAMETYQTFLGQCLAPGALDVVTKELLAVALSLATGCAPCAKLHLRKSLQMGIGMPELEEAAALGIAFGGCRSMTLWSETKRQVKAGEG